VIARQPGKTIKVPRPGFAEQSNDVFPEGKMFDVFPPKYPIRITYWISDRTGLVDEWKKEG
jgi:hypothetical protein